jgi:ribokinase
MSGRVVVVGSVNVDLVVRADHLPAAGETVTGGIFERHDGGKGANQAVAAARLGRPTLFVGAVGDDDFGRIARSALDREGVDTSAVRTLPGESTGVALILVDGRGENLIVVASGANGFLDIDTVRDGLGRLGSLVGDVVLVSHDPDNHAREALRLAREEERGRSNPAPALGLIGRRSPGRHRVPNRNELTVLVAAEAKRTGRRAASADDPARLARRLLEPSPEGRGVGEAVVVTLGSAGALMLAAGRVEEPLEIPAHRVTPVDTTGAGDAFNGALAAALAEGRELGEAVRRAVVAGALATTRAGARIGMPTTAELLAAIATSADRTSQAQG